VSSAERVIAFQAIFGVFGVDPHDPHVATPEVKRLVHEWALKYAQASGYKPPGPPATTERTGERSAVSGDEWTFRFGRNAGKTPRDVDLQDLRWYERAFLKSLENPEKERYRENNMRSLDTVRAELRRRGEAANDD